MPVTLSTFALISDDELRRDLDVPTGHDDMIKDVCNRVSAKVETYLKRQIVTRGELVEYHTFKRYDHELYTIEWPIISFIEACEDPVRVYGPTTVVATNGYIVSKQRGKVTRVLSVGPASWMPGFRVVRVRYTAGYATTADVPEIIKDVCLQMATAAYRTLVRKDQDVFARTDPTGTLTRYSIPDISTRHAAALKPERREFPNSTGQRDD